MSSKLISLGIFYITGCSGLIQELSLDDIFDSEINLIEFLN